MFKADIEHEIRFTSTLDDALFSDTTIPFAPIILTFYVTSIIMFPASASNFNPDWSEII